IADTTGRRQRIRSLPVALAIEAGPALRAFTIEGYLAGLAKAVEIERWPKKVAPRTVFYQEAAQADQNTAAEEQPHPVSPRDAAYLAMDRIGLAGNLLASQESYAGDIEEVSYPTLPERSVLALLATDKEGRLQPTAASTLQAAGLIALVEEAELTALLIVPRSEESQRRAVSHVLGLANGAVVLLSSEDGGTSPEVNSRLLKECWPMLVGRPRTVVGEPWTEQALASLSRDD